MIKTSSGREFWNIAKERQTEPAAEESRLLNVRQHTCNRHIKKKDPPKSRGGLRKLKTWSLKIFFSLNLGLVGLKRKIGWLTGP